MLTTNEISLLGKTREKFYAQDWKYGEAFDSNFVDLLSDTSMTFGECITLANGDTEAYIHLQLMANSPRTAVQ